MKTFILAMYFAIGLHISLTTPMTADATSPIFMSIVYIVRVPAWPVMYVKAMYQVALLDLHRGDK